ncbi:DNA-processing protein DprA [Methylococcus sp. EFPC2]|uniref:DNA-processing protein DprA n=1 Tax=Methylococcus sp. EFPC2 TaxID=2812648 RepID=UPI00196777B9|nr:DNA-processing protein DprA [Methylococcus sp. EFPC2]QSA96805.1 DNA-processing protein DprA [Methylococcus sp. EFPC2]
MRTPRVGPRAFQTLRDHFGSPEGVFSESRAGLTALGLAAATVDGLLAPDWRKVDDDLRWLAEPNRHCLTLDHPDYPLPLREIADPPPVLFVEGAPLALGSLQLAVVGSRNPSPTGEKLARDFSRALAEAGWAVTSGLALGIDAAAHRGALEGRGRTVAVAGTGPDQVYPARHARLAETIVQCGGALVSELPTGTAPQAGNFPRRNRIISGLSRGVLVVEAALRSGSLITARLALEQGREVFAIPGSIQNPLSRGCNALIKQGAKLVETVQDILEELGVYTPAPAAVPDSGEKPAAPDPALASLLKSVAYEPTSVDTLIAATGFAPETITSMLLLLELDGYVIASGGGLYCRIR